MNRYMKYACLLIPVMTLLVGGCRGVEVPAHPPLTTPADPHPHINGVVLPSATNVVRFRLYTNAAPDALRLFNTFEIEAFGQTLLSSPQGDKLRRWLARSVTNDSPHDLLVNGDGPDLSPTNSMSVIEQAVGPDWSFVSLDVSNAYRRQLKEYKRSVLFVEPDMFILHDHLVAREPARFQMLLHPPAETRVDPVWGDLRLELPQAGFTVHAPATRSRPRNWERVESKLDNLLPATATVRLGPTNTLAELDLLTVFVVHARGQRQELAFKLLESTSAVGARIHRQGLPTLVAFRTGTVAGKASLTGFEFNGPVGVDVYKPKRARP